MNVKVKFQIQILLLFVFAFVFLFMLFYFFFDTAREVSVSVTTSENNHDQAARWLMAGCCCYVLSAIAICCYNNLQKPYKYKCRVTWKLILVGSLPANAGV